MSDQATTSDGQATTLPNIIWVFGDQHRGQALGCAGDPNVSTPNIDRLAADGVRFPNAVGGCPLCCPYRGSLLSGRYPHNAVPGHEYQLDPELPTLAQPFGEAGYHTAWFGKWHVDGFHERDGRGGLHQVPRERRGGFDTWLGYENNNAQWDTWVHGHRDHEDVELHRLAGFETDVLTDYFIDHIRDRVKAAGQGQGIGFNPGNGKPGESGRPFFAALSVQPPHNPYVAPQEWMARHTPGRVELRPNVPPIQHVIEKAQRDLAGYYAMIENLDWNLGRIMDTLTELGLYDNTHIIFFSDHGDMHGCHGQFLKTSPWEEALRVPCIIGGGRRYHHRAGAVVDAPMNHVDLSATSLGLAGITPPDWMAGTNYAHTRLLPGAEMGGSDPANDPDSALLQLVVPTMHGHSTDRAWRGVVTTDGWKYIALEHQPWLLFNLNEDPFEFANHAHNTVYRAQRKRLHDRLAQWISDTGDEFALPEL